MFARRPAEKGELSRTLGGCYTPGVLIQIIYLALVFVALSASALADTLITRGSLNPGAQQSGAEQKRPRTRVTLTDKDLDEAKRAREKSERDYERRRVEMGLPETDQAAPGEQSRDESLRKALDEVEGREAGAEAYWRARANQLRTELYAVDSQINFLRTRLAEATANSSRNFVFLPGAVVPFGGYGYGRPGVGAPLPLSPPAIGSNLASRAGIAPRLGLGVGITLGGGYVNGGAGGINHPFYPHMQPYPRPPLVRPRYGYGRAPSVIYALPYNYGNYYDGDYAAMSAQLGQLEVTRAGLAARWRALEDEARRAGAQPGWLRP